jgi:arylsulfatase A-like enzyme
MTLAGACERMDGGAAGAPSQPNIILVSIDSLRADHLGCYGYERPTSPTIDRLAAEGVRFDNAISTSSWTLPAHAAMFTGLYNSAHAIVDTGMRLADEHLTLAEQLSAGGYATVGFFGGPHLHPTFGLAQGFGEYVNCMMPLLKMGDEAEVPDESHHLSHVDITGPRTIEKLTAWLETAKQGRPLFLFLHLWDVHYDYIPPSRYVEMFDPDYHGDVTAESYMRNGAIHPNMTARDLEHVVALYDGEIRFTDDNLGQMLAALDRHGRLENTLIVITSDHGDEFFEHGWKGHQRTLFEEMVRVPLIMHWPGRLDPGLAVEDQACLIDLLPTLLSLAGVPLGSEVQGRDLSPLLRGNTLPAQAALCELLVDDRDYRALRTNEWKVVLDRPARRAFFYDLRADPREQRPLAQMTERFQAALTELRELRNASIARGQRLDRTAGHAQLSDELQARLRSLGYVDDQTEAASSQPTASEPSPPPASP